MQPEVLHEKTARCDPTCVAYLYPVSQFERDARFIKLAELQFLSATGSGQVRSVSLRIH